jgi:hypothetical protein
VEVFEPDELSDEELQVIVEALTLGEEREVDDEEIVRLAKWIHGVQVEARFVQLLLDGRLMVRRRPDGGYEFRMPPPGEAPTL